MFGILRQTWVQHTRGGLPTTGKAARPRGVRPMLERLESRCLLSAAPAPVQDTQELRLPPVILPEQVTAIVGGAAVGRSRGDYARPDYGRGSLLPIPPAGGVDLGDWKENSPGEYPNPTPPEADAPGGLIELGEFGPHGGTPAPPTQSTSNLEIRGILEILAGLQYVPAPASANEIGKSPAAAATDLPGPPPIAGSQEPLHREAIDGGLIALEPGGPISESVGSRPDATQPDDPPLGVTIQMDRLSGRFQAFEVSTAEVLPSTSPPLAPAESGDDPTDSRPSAFDPATVRGVPTATSAGAVPAPPAGSNSTGAGTAETSSDASDQQSLSAAAADGQQTSAPAPATSSITSSRLSQVAAAAILSFYAARTLKPADVRQPGKRKSLQARLWTFFWMS